MGCLSLAFIENVLIWLVVIGLVAAIVRLLLPRFLGQLGDVVTILNWVIVAIITIFVIVIVFDLLSCLLGGSGGGLRLR